MKVENYEEYERLRQKTLLEGALGYMRVLVAHKPELDAVVQKDFERISAALAEYLQEDLRWAGWTVGLFEEPEKMEKEETEQKTA